ncbi:MAG TPA: ABC transporter permease [Acidimicrobiia bacterium]|nr:ABC transporter permease [Acidimicrobiia bacterium]
MTATMRILPFLRWRHRPWRLVERNVLAYRRIWYIFLSGFLEPLLFLLSIGIGVGKLVGDVNVGGVAVPYRSFVAPGLLAIAAMNGSLLDTTFNFFVKMKYSHTYDGVLASPLSPRDVASGEITWALIRGGTYSGAFVLTMLAFGDLRSWWAVLALPGAVVIGFGFAGIGLAATTFMRSFVDFDYVNMAIIPLFLFSATFFPLSRYPAGLQAVIRLTPLYQGVVLERSLTLGDVHWTLLVNIAYLVAMGLIGLRVASRRIEQLLQP